MPNRKQVPLQTKPALANDVVGDKHVPSKDSAGQRDNEHVHPLFREILDGWTMPAYLTATCVHGRRRLDCHRCEEQALWPKNSKDRA